ncbi:MAG: CDP-alcohol phosphatidyltransferase family protein [Candidatus Paceibacterota bacterium]|jgi:phosphatidylglycerophosphate synthase
MLDTRRESFRGLEKAVAKIFSRLPVTPNQYSFSSVLFALVCLYFLIKQAVAWAIVFFLLAAFMDFVDGGVARYKNLSTKKGAYLDTIFDRYVEGITIIGFLFLPLPQIFLPNYILISLVLFGSMMTTYAKSAAKEKELTSVELKGGLMSRGERAILYFLIMLSAIFCSETAVWILMAMALLANMTAIQRIFSAVKN